MSQFAERMIADLRAFSGHLLEPGFDPQHERSARLIEGGTESVLFGAAQAFAALVPRLLEELDGVEDPRQVVSRRTFTATRAGLSRAPSDWQITADGRVYPRRWVRLDADPQPDRRALSWLLHLGNALSSELEAVARRTQRYIEDAYAAREGKSQWALADQDGLKAMAQRTRASIAVLERSRRSILLAADRALLPTEHAPSPFPRGRSWWRLRQLAARIEDKERTLGERIAALLDVRAEVADEPVLYQRWCGMRIIEGLVSLGWRPEGDFVGALYLAGHVAFNKEQGRLDLWIENRLTRELHPSGFVCVRGEDITPDYLLVTQGSGGLDAFVIDATKSTDEAVLDGKLRYLDLLQGVSPAVIAGVISGPRRPLRSWACAPFDLGHCRLGTSKGSGASNGSTGVVPMHPGVWNPAPLRSWLADIDRHARAWGP